MYLCVFKALGLKGGDLKHRSSLERSQRKRLPFLLDAMVYGEDSRNPRWQRLGEGPTGVDSSKYT